MNDTRNSISNEQFADVMSTFVEARRQLESSAADITPDNARMGLQQLAVTRDAPWLAVLSDEQRARLDAELDRIERVLSAAVAS